MGKITAGKPITIRPSKKYNQKGPDGEYLDIESWRDNLTKPTKTLSKKFQDKANQKKEKVESGTVNNSDYP